MTTIEIKISGVIRLAQALLFCLATCSVSALAESVVLDEAAPALSGRLTTSEDWPAGRTALLLHGTLSHRDTEIIESLELLLGEAGFTTLAINLSLGQDARDGPFACESIHRHLETDAIGELERWVGWLKAAGATDLTLVGHSRGANQALRYALQAPEYTVDRLVLIAPPRWGPEAARSAYRERNAMELDEILALATQQLAAGDGDELLPVPVGLLYCADAQVTARSFLSYYSDYPLRDTPTALADARLPVLVVAGSEDPIVTGLVEAVSDKAPHVAVEEIDGADHFFRDLYADDLVEIAVEFIEETP